MQIAVYLADQNPHRDRSLGITRMTQCQLACLQDLEEQWEFVPIESTSSAKSGLEHVRRITLPFRTDNVVGRLLADHTHPWLLPKDLRPDAWYYPKGFLPKGPRRKGPYVITIHDTILAHYAEKYPHVRSAWNYRYWIGMLDHSLRKADLVLTVSETACKQIQAFCDRLEIRLKRPIAITYEASEYECAVPPLWEHKGEYVVHCASTAPHKQTERLLAWWKELQTLGHALPVLKLTGTASLRARQFANGIRHFEWVGHLEDSDFRELVGRARVLLLPSEVEGFGLPALEACLLETPVCYVAGTSVDEILGLVLPEGRFNISDCESFYYALSQTLNVTANKMKQVRQTLLNRFSKRLFAERTAQAFRQLCGSV